MPFRWTLTNLNNLNYEVLQNDPIGWDETTYTLQRSATYKSVMHEFSTPVKFHCKGGGKQFIDDAYNQLEVDARMDILVEYDCDGSGTYDTLFNGIINFATYRIDNDYTVCQIERSDLMAKFINRDDTPVNLNDLPTDPDAGLSIGDVHISTVTNIGLQMESVNVLFENISEIKSGYEYQINNETEDTGVAIFWAVPETSTVKTDMATQSATTGTSTVQTVNSNFEDQTLVRPIYIANESLIQYPINVKYEIYIKGFFSDEKYDGPADRDNQHVNLILYYGKQDPAIPGSINSVTLIPGGGYSSDFFSYPFGGTTLTGNITLKAGDSIWLVWYYANQNAVGGAYANRIKWVYEQSSIKLTVNSIFPNTKTKSVLAHEAFNQVVDAIADSNGNFISNFYGRTDSQKQTYATDGCGSHIAITNGLRLREIEAGLYCSFSDLFQAFDCLHNIGAGYENGKIRVEQLAYWYDNTVRIATLPFVNTFNVKDYNTAYKSVGLFGFDKWQNEYRGGLNDVSAKHTYKTIVSSVKNIYQKISRYIASSYTIEFTRRKNITLRSSEDWRYDNDNFFIAVTKTNTDNFVASFSSEGGFYITIYAYLFMQIGDLVTVSDSTDNNADFTIVNIVYEGNKTIIKVAETVVDRIGDQIVFTNNSRSFYKPEKYAHAFTGGSGMGQIETQFNLRLTPKRMLLAHLNVITAGLQKIQGAISFVKGEGNTNLKVTKNNLGCQEDFDGQPLAENQSIEWSDDRAANIHPLWLPQVYTFEYPLTYQQFKTIKANPNGYIEFYRFENQKHAGYILSMEYQIKTGITKFELLRIFAPEAVGDENGNYVGDENGMIVGLTNLRG